MNKKFRNRLLSAAFLIFGFIIAQTLATISGMVSAKLQGSGISGSRSSFTVLIYSFLIFLTVDRLAIWGRVSKIVHGSWKAKGKRAAFVPLALIFGHFWMFLALLVHGMVSTIIFEIDAPMFLVAVSKLIVEAGLGFLLAVFLIFKFAKLLGFEPSSDVRRGATSATSQA